MVRLVGTFQLTALKMEIGQTRRRSLQHDRPTLVAIAEAPGAKGEGRKA